MPAEAGVGTFHEFIAVLHLSMLDLARTPQTGKGTKVALASYQSPPPGDEGPVVEREVSSVEKTRDTTTIPTKSMKPMLVSPLFAGRVSLLKLCCVLRFVVLLSVAVPWAHAQVIIPIRPLV